jgi:DNA-binding MarR family transcriptional regulator
MVRYSSTSDGFGGAELEPEDSMVEQANSTDTSGLLSAIVLKSLTAAAESWARIDLTMPQLKVLLLLGDRGSVPVNWLASRMDVSPPNITGILDRLEQHHWVHRAGDSLDRRVVRIALTTEGERLLRDLSSAGVKQLLLHAGSLPRGESESLQRGLRDLLGVMQHSRPASTESMNEARQSDNHVVNGQMGRQADRARA